VTIAVIEGRYGKIELRNSSNLSESLANGLLGNGRIARLSYDSAITELSVQAKSPSDLVDRIVMRILSRPPTADEKRLFVAHLKEGFSERLTQPSAASNYRKAGRRPVSWSNHLNPEATRIKQELEKEVRSGDTPTERLRPDWRERMEDIVWALVNTPEFVFVP